MDEASIVSHMATSFTIFIILTLPPLFAALIAGLIVGIIQAATQIQDQTLPQTVKLLVVVSVLGFLSPLLAAPLIEHTKRLFVEFPGLTMR